MSVVRRKADARHYGGRVEGGLFHFGEEVFRIALQLHRADIDQGVIPVWPDLVEIEWVMRDGLAMISVCLPSMCQQFSSNVPTRRRLAIRSRTPAHTWACQRFCFPSARDRHQSVRVADPAVNSAAFEPGRLHGYRYMNNKLLRLRESKAGHTVAEDTCRETQIVLADAATGIRLCILRQRIQRCGATAFQDCTHRHVHSCWGCVNDHHIIGATARQLLCIPERMLVPGRHSHACVNSGSD